MTAPGDVVIDGLVVLLLSTGSLDQGARVTSPPQRDSPRPVNSVRPNRSRPSWRCARRVPRAGTSRANRSRRAWSSGAGSARPTRELPEACHQPPLFNVALPEMEAAAGVDDSKMGAASARTVAGTGALFRYGEVFVVICCTRDRPKRPDCGWTCGLYPSCAGCLIVVRSVT